ncbi:MAG: hypothetical protein ACM3QS_16895 [Bacteroidota bacterium]
MKTSLLKISLNGIGVAMGVAVIVLNIISPLPPAESVNLLAFGVAALSLAALQK